MGQAKAREPEKLVTPFGSGTWGKDGHRYTAINPQNEKAQYPVYNDLGLEKTGAPAQDNS